MKRWRHLRCDLESSFSFLQQMYAKIGNCCTFVNEPIGSRGGVCLLATEQGLLRSRKKSRIHRAVAGTLPTAFPLEAAGQPPPETNPCFRVTSPVRKFSPGTMRLVTSPRHAPMRRRQPKLDETTRHPSSGTSCTQPFPPQQSQSSSEVVGGGKGVLRWPAISTWSSQNRSGPP